jgi:hypothetical protein
MPVDHWIFEIEAIDLHSQEGRKTEIFGQRIIGCADGPIPRNKQVIEALPRGELADCRIRAGIKRNDPGTRRRFPGRRAVRCGSASLHCFFNKERAALFQSNTTGAECRFISAGMRGIEFHRLADIGEIAWKAVDWS